MSRKSSSSQDGLGDDERSIREETTLGACLKRILDKDRYTSGEDEVSGARPKDKASHPNNPAACKRPSSESPEKGNDDHKLRKWREAGAALRKALAEASKNNDKDGEEPLFEAAKDIWKNSNGDPMNAMLEEYKSQQQVDVPNGSQTDNTTSQIKENVFSHRDYRKILEEHFRKKKADGDYEDKRLTPGLLSVREKIKEITSRINESAKHNKKGQHGPNKNPTPRRLSRAPSRNPSQEVISSESEPESEVSRHKFVPKCRRTSSTGSPKPRKKCSKEGDGSRSGGHSGHSGKDDGPRYSLLVASSDDEATQAQVGAVTDQTLDLSLKPGFAAAVPSDSSDTEADVIAKKLQDLVRKHQHEQLHQQHHHHVAVKPKTLVHGIKRLSAIEADSLPNLADIESSPVTDDPGTLNNESENEVFLPGGLRDPEGLRIDKDNIMCSSCGSEVSDIKWFEGRRNSERSAGAILSGHFLSNVPDNGDMNEGMYIKLFYL